jgi:hypothetical protein
VNIPQKNQQIAVQILSSTGTHSSSVPPDNHGFVNYNISLFSVLTVLQMILYIGSDGIFYLPVGTANPMATGFL